MKPKPLLRDLNVVPYIDVMLVLLVVFMMAAPVLHQGVVVELPKTQPHEAVVIQDPSPPLVVTLTPKGMLSLNGSANMEVRELLLRLKAEQWRAPGRSVLVRADGSVSYALVVQLLGACQQAGITQVGLITEPWEEKG